jgi:ketosteroid isomerase-like protein
MKSSIAALALLFAVALPAQSQAPSKDEAVHNELRALRDGMLAAIKKGDIDAQLVYLHPNVVVTWQNGELSRGRDGVRAYLNRTLHGAGKVVDSYSTEVNVDELTILYGGDTGISFGSALDHFNLTSGTSLDVPSRWSATLVNESGKWLIGSVHSSTNLFDNPLLSAAKQLAYIAGGAGLVLGLVAGFLLGRRKRAA